MYFTSKFVPVPSRSAAVNVGYMDILIACIIEIADDYCVFLLLLFFFFFFFFVFFLFFFVVVVVVFFSCLPQMKVSVCYICIF